MRVLGRKITSPRVDAVIMLLVAWALFDLGGVALATNNALGYALGFAAGVSFLIAAWSWQRKSAG